MKKIILSADSTCDLGPELKRECDVHYFHYKIQIGDQTYTDMVEIAPDDIYRIWRDKGILPKTAAITPADYYTHFKQWVSEGYDVLHLNLGSGLSSAYQNCCIAARELTNVYAVDSQNLSTGLGLLVVKARELIDAGYSAPDIQRMLVEMCRKSHASFILDTLEFMRAGGRCSAVTAFGANLLQLKPCIEVENQNGGRMRVGKKYRGSVEKVLHQYISDKVSNRNDLDRERVFITHSGSPESDIQTAAGLLQNMGFQNIHITRANGTISAHCGPRTLGVLFMTK